MKKGLVSCIIPTYKRADMLPRAINSVLAQTYPFVEILVVDDNEPLSEESLAVKKMLELTYGTEDRVRYIQQEKHINGAVARNVGIYTSDAEYIAFLDDDEEWEATKIQLQVDYLSKNLGVQGVSCYYTDFKNGKPYRHIAPYTAVDLQLKVLTNRVMIHTSTFLCRRECLIKSGAFNPNLLRHQDLQLFVDFLNVGKIEPIEQYLVKNHIDSEINRPDYTKLVSVKKAFFEAINETIVKYDKRTQKRIKDAHNFGLLISAYRSKKFFAALKYALKIGLSPNSYHDLYERKKSFIYD